MKKTILFLIINFASISLIYSQTSKTDSIFQEINKLKEDTAKVIELNTKALQFASIDNENAMLLAEKALEISEKSKYKKGTALVYKTIGIIHFYKGETDKAFEYFYKSLDSYKDAGDKSGVARSYVNIGIIYRTKQDYPNSLKSYNSALEVFKETNDTEGIALTYLNIGNIYNMQGNYKLALENYLISRKYFEETDDKIQTAKIYSNIGTIHGYRKEKKEALEYFNKSLKIYDLLKDTLGMADQNNNIGYIYIDGDMTDMLKSVSYFEKSLALYQATEIPEKIALSYYNLGDANNNLKKYDRALENYKKSLSMFESLNDDKGKAMCYIGLGEYYYNTSKFGESIKYLESANKLLVNSEFDLRKKTAEMLSSAYAKNGNYKKALDNQILFKQMNDSIFSKQNEKEITSLSMQYEFDKQKNMDEVAHKEEMKRQRLVTWGFTLGLLLMIIIAIILIWAYRNKIKANKLLSEQKKEIEFKNIELEQQKEEIEAQRDEIEHINVEVTEQRDLALKQKKEITDSINYALRIQEALLPSQKILDDNIGTYFILNKPRDIVSGDFYWMSKIETKIIVTAVDCTGHGVPGGFMSMLGISFLNDIVNNDKVTEADKILNILREKVIDSLHQNFRESKDGMDMSLAVIDTSINEIEYAGAYNPLIIIPGSKSESEIVILKADRMPIGIHMKEILPFTSKKYSYKPGDSIYLSSDGYEDQFGGEKGRKLKAGSFYEILRKIQDKDMTSQKNYLDDFHKEWKGTQFQVDDILVIGLKL